MIQLLLPGFTQYISPITAARYIDVDFSTALPASTCKNVTVRYHVSSSDGNDYTSWGRVRDFVTLSQQAYSLLFDRCPSRLWVSSDAVMRTHHTLRIYEGFYRSIKDYIMPKKRAKAASDFVWQGYANVHIPASRVSECASWIEDDDLVWDAYLSALDGVYHFKVQREEKDGSYRTTMVCHDPDSSNFGYALSAWADDPRKSLAVVLFKHQEIAVRDWAAHASRDETPFR